MRDRRDPQALGEAYLERRKKGVPIKHAVMTPAQEYEDGPFMSANPADHHSKTPQTKGKLDE